MKKYIVFILILQRCFAVVATTDIGPAGQRATQQTAQDTATMSSYVASITSTMGKINDTLSITQQMKNLQGLQKLQAAGALCQLCTKNDQAQLHSYQQSINDDLCSQFSLSYKNLTGIKNAANNLKDIMGLLSSNPQAALMSLQQATISAQQTTNSTLAQMQMMQAQMVQKQLADEKVSNQSAAAMGDSLGKYHKW